MRPLLLLDVDGVLSPVGQAIPQGFERRETSQYSVVINPQHRIWLHDLLNDFDVVWATTWGNNAQAVYGEILDLPKLEVLQLRNLQRTGTRKLPDVIEFVSTRPCAWIDDELYDDAFEWASNRNAPTLLVRTASFVGMTQADVDKLIRFAEELQ